MSSSVTERFLRYVAIDTQSDPASSAQPSTEKQKNLARLLVEELLEIGIADAHMDEHGNVYATVPANTDKQVPVICFCAHVDTAPDFTGKGVKPQIVSGYEGGDILLPGDSSRVIRAADHAALADQIGNDIITTDGTTLLGADDKAGVAEIVAAAQILIQNPDLRHGKIRILFTTDEEIGRGVDKVDLDKLGADFAYTMDGSTAGSIENETFSADRVDIEITGVAIHPGFAKGRMQHATKIAAAIIERLPRDEAPETTSGRQGFLHPTDMRGTMDHAFISLIARDFDEAELAAREARLRTIVDDVMKGFPGSTCTFKVTEQYRNMKTVLDRYPQVVENAVEAISRCGMTPKPGSIRGGTDGARLTLMGLPCPNIFAGGHAFHSPLEWVSRQDMEKAVATIVELARIWEERA